MRTMRLRRATRASEDNNGIRAQCKVTPADKLGFGQGGFPQGFNPGEEEEDSDEEKGGVADLDKEEEIKEEKEHVHGDNCKH